MLVNKMKNSIILKHRKQLFQFTLHLFCKYEPKSCFFFQQSYLSVQNYKREESSLFIPIPWESGRRGKVPRAYGSLLFKDNWIMMVSVFPNQGSHCTEDLGPINCSTEKMALLKHDQLLYPRIYFSNLNKHIFVSPQFIQYQRTFNQACSCSLVVKT